MRAFTLRAGHEDFAGGQIAIPPEGKTLDVKRRLGTSGVIITDDHVEGEALANFPALKELAGEERDQALQANGPAHAQAQADAADAVTRAELQARAEELGLPKSGTKDEIQARIDEAENSKGGDV